jgi:hypothetical protein
LCDQLPANANSRARAMGWLMQGQVEETFTMTLGSKKLRHMKNPITGEIRDQVCMDFLPPTYVTHSVN